MLRLLFDDGGHINDLVAAVSNAVGHADRIGAQEICQGAIQKAEKLAASRSKK